MSISVVSAYLGPEAQKKLRKWKVSDKLIQQLTEDILPQFEYRNCVKKLERLAKRNILLATKNDGTEVAIIPFVYDIMGRGDGECGDLSRQLILNGRFRSWLDKVNVHRIIPITPVLCHTGLSKTHFNQEGFNHVFVYLATTSENPDDVVIVDPSFQNVETQSESGYVITEKHINPSDIASNLSETITIGSCNLDQDNFYTIVDGLVLGATHDRKHVIRLSLHKDKKSHKIVPLITRVHSDGKTFDFFWINPNNNQRISGKFDAQSLSPEDTNEIIEMLLVANRFSYITDKSKFPIPLNYDLSEPGATVMLDDK